ncbi:hypothetical protein QO034_16900 [Sedimentitalea sp. JM2-8]|uniref:Uncharacterized protein n=1 Tax=Sedimentitalea xiamensis TaxID=3050037 RepID=A0ABT7FI06_9RHOB|nr:hypothetical protein [Sedimentitalea xiamensis]MDK3074770.1 hypothetical protein [Sedimentitalea xiamensis]
MRTDPGRVAVLCASLIVACAPALAGDVTADAWTRQKCELYNTAWQSVSENHDMTGVSPQFLARHRDFIDSGCSSDEKICAATASDLDLADLMTILSMNEGMASTFVPFGCQD